jgi:peptide-methionine (S)-S-oxide reductase
MAVATFAMGCFWHPQKLFDELQGVEHTEVGYTGGNTANPDYKEVCSGNTGHAEAVRIEYDENIISYKQLLEVFWNNHDYCQLNRQGPDIGEQYRSAIFYHTPQQEKLAKESKPEESVTQIQPATQWYKAEEHHQHYYK